MQKGLIVRYLQSDPRVSPVQISGTCFWVDAHRFSLLIYFILTTKGFWGTMWIFCPKHLTSWVVSVVVLPFSPPLYPSEYWKLSKAIEQQHFPTCLQHTLSLCSLSFSLYIKLSWNYLLTSSALCHVLNLSNILIIFRAAYLLFMHSQKKRDYLSVTVLYLANLIKSSP